jgi:hypothetical protein
MKGPAWRSQRAEQLASSRESARATRYDALTQEAVAYLRRRRSGPDGQRRADEQYPSLSAAYDAWADEATAESLRLLVLARCSQEEIADRLQLDVETVSAVEGLFFDIRWALDASNWIICHVIIPEMKSEAWDVAAKMRLAYFGGPGMAQAILDARLRLPFEEAGRLFDRQVLLHVKLQEALEAPLTNGERMEFLRFYMDFEIKRQRLELDKKKFAYECKRDEQQGTPTSQPQGTKANNPNDDGASSKADEPMQTEDCHSVVMKDLWKRVVA